MANQIFNRLLLESIFRDEIQKSQKWESIDSRMLIMSLWNYLYCYNYKGIIKLFEIYKENKNKNKDFRKLSPDEKKELKSFYREYEAPPKERNLKSFEYQLSSKDQCP